MGEINSLRKMGAAILVMTCWWSKRAACRRQAVSSTHSGTVPPREQGLGSVALGETLAGSRRPCSGLVSSPSHWPAFSSLPFHFSRSPAGPFPSSYSV